MKKIKFTSILLVILLLSTSLIGCTQKKNDSSSEISSNAVEETTTKTDVDSNQNGDEKQNETNSKNNNTTEEEALPDFIVDETETSVTYLNPLGEEATITKKPQKVIVLMNSILDIWYMAGGEAIARVSCTTNVPEAAMDIEQVGEVNGPNIEKLLSLEPDLVVLSSTRGEHVEMKEILESNNIELAYVDISTNPYDNFNDVLKLFTMITDREDIYKKEIKALQEEVTKICESVKNEEQPKVVILFGSTKYVKAELPCGLVGNMVEMLGAKNIIEESPVKGSSKVDFSLETIIKENPDVVLIVTMGDIEKVKERIKSDIESNEAWSSLTAVQNQKVYYLPGDLFHYKPNARYPEAFRYLGELLYPQVFKNEQN